MKSNFEQALAAVLVWEGGYVNHPKDPGGATMKGVTQKVYDRYRQQRGGVTKDVRYIDEAELRDIYKAQYWDLIAGDALPSGVDLAVFDYAVNSGATRAGRALQQVCGVRVDGNVGLSTAAAAKGMDPEKVIDGICDERLAFMRRLSTFSTFGKGWVRRVDGIRKTAVSMTTMQVAMFAELPPDMEVNFDSTPADPRDISVTSTNTGRGVATSGLGIMGTTIGEAADKISTIAPYSTIITSVSVFLLLVGVGLSMYGILKSIREERAV